MLDDLPYPMTYVVPECEAGYWAKQKVRSLIVPDEYKFSDIRQYILGLPTQWQVVMDDDLSSLAVRLNEGDWHARNINGTAGCSLPLFNIITSLLRDGWIHGGVSAREGNNRSETDYKVVCREMRFHFYNAGVVRELGFDFRRTVTKQDFDFTLWMLRRGIPNVVIYKYMQGQPGSSKNGGCSWYRDDKVMQEGARRLAELHPGLVRIVEKATKHAWGGGVRTDVTVAWAKAYKEGLEHVENLRRKDPATLDAEDRAVLRLQSKLPVLPDQQPARNKR